MSLNRRQAMVATAALGAMGSPSLAQTGRSYPSAPIRFVIPSAAGGGHDIMMRLIGHKLSERLGQPCIVESRPGASGVLATSAVRNAPADGHTLLVCNSSFLSNTLLMDKLPYTLRDFAPLSMLALTPIALGISASLAATTLGEYVALAQSRPGKLFYASYGPGSGGHFVGELFNMAAQIDVVHVPYKGETPALLDVLGGQVQAAFTSAGGASRYPGRIRPLAIATRERSPSYPEVPTFAELGYPAVDMPGWAALMAPVGTPAATLQLLTREINAIVLLPDVQAKMAELGFDTVGWDVPRTQAFLAQQLEATRKLVALGRVKL